MCTCSLGTGLTVNFYASLTTGCWKYGFRHDKILILHNVPARKCTNHMLVVTTSWKKPFNATWSRHCAHLAHPFLPSFLPSVSHISSLARLAEEPCPPSAPPRQRHVQPHPNHPPPPPPRRPHRPEGEAPLPPAGAAAESTNRCPGVPAAARGRPRWRRRRPPADPPPPPPRQSPPGCCSPAAAARARRAPSGCRSRGRCRSQSCTCRPVQNACQLHCTEGETAFSFDAETSLNEQGMEPIDLRQLLGGVILGMIVLE